MATGTERSKPLHNFTLPCDLRWGNQRFLRCMKVNIGGQISPRHRVDANSSDSSDQHRRDREREGQRSKDLPNGRRLVDDVIPAKRAKVMLDLQTDADKMKRSGLEEGKVSVSPPPQAPPVAASADGEIQRPWNLRTRRAACRTPGIGFVAAGGGSDGGCAKGSRADSPAHPKTSGKKLERAKFSLSLSKREIEEDFFAFAGRRPPRKPKKRTRVVQKHLDRLHQTCIEFLKHIDNQGFNRKLAVVVDGIDSAASAFLKSQRNVEIPLSPLVG